MASGDHFQPENPHPDTKGSGGSRTTIFVTAAAAAVMVIMLLAIAAPRVLGEGGARWLLTLGAGVLTFVVVVGIGFMRSSPSRE